MKLCKWGISTISNCVLCGFHEETETHLWFECEYVQRVVKDVFTWLGITHYENSIGAWLQWYGSDNRPKHIIFQSKLLGFCAIIYYTWKARNFAIHRDIVWSHSECSMLIIRACKERIDAKCKFATIAERGWERFLAR